MVKHGNWFQLYRIIVLYYSDIVLVTNWIAGTPLELKYSFLKRNDEQVLRLGNQQLSLEIGKFNDYRKHIFFKKIWKLVEYTYSCKIKWKQLASLNKRWWYSLAFDENQRKLICKLICKVTNCVFNKSGPFYVNSCT